MQYKQIFLIIGLLFTFLITAQAQQVVKTETVQLQKLQQYNRVTGNLKALSKANLAVRESGYVAKVFVNEGTRVKKGDILLQLDKRRLNSQLAQSTAELNQAKATVKQRKVELENAKVELEADQYSAQKKAISQRTLRSSKTVVNVSRASLQAAQAAVEAHNAQIQYLKVRLADLSLRAPFDGLITERIAEQGEWFNQGQKVISMVADAKLEAWLDVPERFVHQLSNNPKQEVNLKINDINLTSNNLITIGDVDIQARTFTLVARFNNNEKLMPGMSVLAWLPLGEKKQLLTVTKSALVQRNSEFKVYKVVKTEEGDVASEVIVEVLFYQDGRAAIESNDLQQGDSVVNEGNERLVPGPVITEKSNKPTNNNTITLAK